MLRLNHFLEQIDFESNSPIFLRMEVGQPNDASNDDVFEYNNHLPEEAQVIWLAEWLRQKQREFNLNSDLIAQNTAYVKKLADLFKESYEVKTRTLVEFSLLILL